MRDVHGLIFGIEVLGMGILGIFSVFFPLEFAVYAGGPLVALVAALYIGSKWKRRESATGRFLGGVVLGLGVLLATHDYIFRPDIAIPVHFAVAVGLVVVAAMQTLYARSTLTT